MHAVTGSGAFAEDVTCHEKAFAVQLFRCAFAPLHLLLLALSLAIVLPMVFGVVPAHALMPQWLVIVGLVLGLFGLVTLVSTTPRATRGGHASHSSEGFLTLTLALYSHNLAALSLTLALALSSRHAPNPKPSPNPP